MQTVHLNSTSAKECRLVVQRENARRGEKLDGGGTGRQPVFRQFTSAAAPEGRADRAPARHPAHEGWPSDGPRRPLGPPPCAECGAECGLDGWIDARDEQYYCHACWARFEGWHSDEPRAPPRDETGWRTGELEHRDKRRRAEPPWDERRAE